ncbi:hypothetical protein J2782_000810 [Brucella pseudogrignonensis]|uniref:Uncharacterized protein n=1 Tax=Brucella pseudogrignonensis TaxID=419475 RepID=A0ABU1M5I2_9HYPH|nr:hypothetical protein [Brucella pseudogrignonensis]
MLLTVGMNVSMGCLTAKNNVKNLRIRCNYGDNPCWGDKDSQFPHNFISKLKAGLEIEFRKVLKKRHAHYIVATITAIIALTFATVGP